ncbi:hypothetical protein [Streptomyces sp. 900116325]
MSILNTVFRGTGTHRSKTPAQLRAELDDATCTLIALTTEIESLTVQRNSLEAQLDSAGIELSGAREDVATQTAELIALRAFRDNATAVTVGLGERDTSAMEDQATTPVGIDVKPLWEALGITPIRVADAPAATDPRTPTWIPGQPNAETTQTFRVPTA